MNRRREFLSSIALVWAMVTIIFYVFDINIVTAGIGLTIYIVVMTLIGNWERKREKKDKIR